MLIDCKIDVKIWESERAMDRNGERGVLKSYLMELFELQNFTLKLLSPKPYNEYGIGFKHGWTINYTFRLKKLLEGEFNHTLFSQFSYFWSPSKLQVLGVSDSFL